jgi:uncharacterized membrane protein
MEEAALLLIVLGLGLIGSGPLALILVIVFNKKLTQVESRLDRMEKYARPANAPVQTPAPVPQSPAREPAWAGRAEGFDPAPTPQRPSQPTETPPAAKQPVVPVEPVKPIEKTPPPEPARPPAASAQTTVSRPVSFPPAQKTPIRTEVPPVAAPKRPASVGGLELKVGTVVILIAGIITMIFGVAFFLRYIYEKGYFNPTARVALVAAGGLAAIIIGEISRRRNFEIVARGIAALGFALLYAAVFSGSRVYGLFSSEWAFALSIVVTAGAMTYAVVLNEILIAFLSLLGGYLAPAIITTGQNLPVPLFSYVLVLSTGAMGCAMFRRWRAVNWIALTGTWLLYTAWFERFYTSDQLTVALVWLSVFAVLYMVLPVLFSLVRRIEARVEDVVLVVVNGIGVFYYLWQILNRLDQKWLAIGTAVLGAAHLAMMCVAQWRTAADKKLHAALGVLGVVLISASLPMYFSLQATLVGWAAEAVVLTYIGIRYRGIWTQVMAFLVAGVAAAGLFYHLPLHAAGDFRVFLNAPFGTWVCVSAALLICHLFWRYMRPQSDPEASAASQMLYITAVLLLGAGAVLEWHAHCRLNMLYASVGQALFLKGMMVLAILLVGSLFVRPVCPSGVLVQNAGVLLAFIGAIFFAVASMAVYQDAFTLFLNLPFALALVYILELSWIAWRFRGADQDAEGLSLSSAFVFLGMLLLLTVLTEQMYSYWFCRHEYAGFEGDWKSHAIRYILITWALYGLAALFAGIRFEKKFIQGTAGLVTGLSAAGLVFMLPLHRDAQFQLFYNFPFVTWLIVAVAVLAGHALWRFMRQGRTEQSQWMTQLYYTAGILLLAAGAGLEWAAHTQWHLEPDTLASSHLVLGLIIITGLTVQLFFARPLAPSGGLVTLTGAAAALAGSVYLVSSMLQVYHSTFKLFWNWPFAIAVFYAVGVLLAAWHWRRADRSHAGQFSLSSALVLLGLVLIWILLSQQIYSYWDAKQAYGPIDLPNWRLSAQTGISVTWGLYAAFLMVIGFGVRSARVRWLSLLIFAVLLGKIFIIDIPSLRTEYRIAAFITTGLLLIGVSFLYQLLKNKGFFGKIDGQKQMQ